MSSWFKVGTVPTVNLLHLRMGGFFDLSGVGQLREELLRNHAALRCEPNQHLTLCDISEMSIQSQDMVEQFARLVGHPSLRSRRLAFVTGATLARLQARRLTSRSDVEFFTGEAAALSWLHSRDGGSDGAARECRAIVPECSYGSGTTGSRSA